MDYSIKSDYRISNNYGYCHYCIDERYNPIVYDLFVYEEYRKRGHGTDLLNTVIKEIREKHSGSCIDIEVEPTDRSMTYEMLEGFYLSLGLLIISPDTREKRGEQS